MYEKERKLAWLLLSIPTFDTRQRAARNYTNPQTGAETTIAEVTTPVFKVGKVLKGAVKYYSKYKL